MKLLLNKNADSINVYLEMSNIFDCYECPVVGVTIWKIFTFFFELKHKCDF